VIPLSPDLRDDAVGLLSRIIRVLSVPDAGRETDAARVLYKWAAAQGIFSRIVEPRPGKGSFVAALPGAGPTDLGLLAHLDVAPANPQDWSVAPFAGAIRDGAIWGRGAVDCKGLAVVWLVALCALRRRHSTLRRGVLLVAAADEESGGRWGMSWLAEHLPEFAGVCCALSEGGGHVVPWHGGSLLAVQTGEKGLVVLRVPARRVPGCGTLRARAPASPSTVRLLRAVGRRPPSEALPFDRDELLRDTFAAVPADDGTVEVRIRTRPGVSAGQAIAAFCQQFRLDLTAVVAEAAAAGTESPLDTELYDAIRSVAASYCPGTRLVPHVTPGISDARFLRMRGVPVYGFFPFLPAAEAARQHGRDERLSVAALWRAAEVAASLLESFCAGTASGLAAKSPETNEGKRSMRQVRYPAEVLPRRRAHAGGAGGSPKTWTRANGQPSGFPPPPLFSVWC
jgi:acetylornithine deacetylase/succinyl-diaminopimelate desuccinylase-like protein